MFNLYPYKNLNDFNLDYILKTLKQLKETVETFIATETVTFADPILWNISSQYAKNTIVLSNSGDAYLSKQAVPVNIQLENADYWQEIFNFADYVRTANSNLTFNIEQNTTRATDTYAIDDWLLWDDVLYKVTSAIAVDDLLVVDTNIVHFTVEDFIKAFMTWATNTIQQYKNDIDASELAYRNQLAQDIANTTNSLQAQLDAAISGATVDSEVINARISINGITYDTLGNAIRGQLGDLIEALKRDGLIIPYIYKVDEYINASGVENSLTGYNIYRIPIVAGDLITISSTQSYRGVLGATNVHGVRKTDASYIAIPTAVGSGVGIFIDADNKAIVIAPTDAEYLYVNVQQGYEDYITILKNNIGNFAYDESAITRKDVTEKASKIADFDSNVYLRYPDKTFRTLTGYNVIPVSINKDDVIMCGTLPGSLTFYGTFLNLSDLSLVQLTRTFKAPAKGIAFLFDDYLIKSGNGFDSQSLQFDGLNGVAFGTSITYRALTTYGYLQHLPQLSGITFDNQGVGGSGITTGTLTAIQSYTDYADKNVCIIEGFVNDWYNGATLGQYTDSGTTTACGCLRTAINYIKSQNANIQIFIVFDHYGKLTGGGDCSSTALNGNGLTQYEYYSELQKVAESMGVACVPLYKESGIGENTPQYLTDNIHPTDLGARQTAYCIWYKMRQFSADQI